MAKRFEVGDLSTQEVIECSTECLGMLTLTERIQVVLKAFDDNEREELKSWLDQPEDEESEEESEDEEGE